MLLGSGHYPPTFTMVPGSVAIDLTEPLVRTAACRTIGLPADAITAGPVSGDTYVSGSLRVSSGALRVTDAGVARALLEELGSVAGKRCLGSLSGGDGPVLTDRYLADDIDVLEVRDTAPTGGLTLVLVTRHETLLLGWLSEGRVDERLADLIVALLVERLSGRPATTPPVARISRPTIDRPGRATRATARFRGRARAAVRIRTR